MLNSRTLLGLLSTVALLTTTGCTSLGGQGGVGGEGETIVIGGLAPLTGDSSAYGVEFQRVAEIALTDINAAWADKGLSLDIQWEDGGCNGQDASTATQKLVDVDKVQVILGGFCSSETLAAAPITEAAKVLLFSPGSSSPDVTNAGDYVFRNWPSDAFQGKKLASLAQELGYKKVGMITEQQDYTFGISSVFKTEFEAAGGTVIEEKYLSEDTDFKTQLTKLKSAGADVIFVNTQTPIKADTVLKQMTELGFTGPFLLNDVAGTSTDVLSTHKILLEGSYTATPYLDESGEAFKKLVADYQTKHGSAFQYVGYGSSIYDATWVLANALDEKGNDATALKDYFNNFPGYTGLTGELKFDANGDPMNGHSVFVIKDGALSIKE